MSSTAGVAAASLARGQHSAFWWGRGGVEGRGARGRHSGDRTRPSLPISSVWQQGCARGLEGCGEVDDCPSWDKRRRKEVGLLGAEQSFLPGACGTVWCCLVAGALGHCGWPRHGHAHAVTGQGGLESTLSTLVKSQELWSEAPCIQAGLGESSAGVRVGSPRCFSSPRLATPEPLARVPRAALTSLKVPVLLSF